MINASEYAIIFSISFLISAIVSIFFDVKRKKNVGSVNSDEPKKHKPVPTGAVDSILLTWYNNRVLLEKVTLNEDESKRVYGKDLVALSKNLEQYLGEYYGR